MPFLYTVGVVGIAPLIAMSMYLCLAFSTGRLQTASDRRLLAALLFVLVLFFGASLLLSPTLVGEGRPLATCSADCPGNPFQVGSEPQLLDGVANRHRCRSGHRRRYRSGLDPALPGSDATAAAHASPVAATSLLLVPSLFVFYFSVLVVGVGEETYDALSWLLVGMWIVFPLGFAIALLQADLFAGQAFRRLLSELANRPTPSG